MKTDDVGGGGNGSKQREEEGEDETVLYEIHMVSCYYY
jgi:hypothetical protein